MLRGHVLQGTGIPVEVRSLDGDPIRGELIALEPERVTVAVANEASPRVLSRDGLVGLRVVGSTGASPFASTEALADVELLDGGRVVGTLLGGSGDVLQVGLGSSRIDLRVESVRRILFPRRVPATLGEPVNAPGSDRLYRLRPATARGEAGVEPVNGTLVAFAPEGVDFETVLGTTRFAWSEIAALVVTPVGAAGASSIEPNAVISLVPEGRIEVKLLGAGVDGFRCESRVLPRTVLPPSAVGSIRFRSERFADLSSLAPSAVEESPYFGGPAALSFPWRRDRSVVGTPLRVGGVEFATGLGVHARSRLTWTIDGAYAELRGLVGIDDSTLPLPRRGSVVFRVAGDGKTLWESPVLRTGERALELPSVPLTGVASLMLEVDYADGFDVADRADWCEPILLRAPVAAR